MTQLETRPAEKPRGGNGEYIRTAEQAALDHYAAKLRAQSKTFREIGEILNVPVSTAHLMVSRAMEDIPREATIELVALELAKIDYLEQKAHEILVKHHVHVTPSGKVAQLDGEIIEDDAPVLAAINTLSKLGERRAKLLGLNAPTRTELTSTVSVSIEDKSQEARGSVLALLSRLDDG